MSVDGHGVPSLGAAKVTGEPTLRVRADAVAELLLVDVLPV